uniref:Uncharacterized protein n=1 Tax=Anguilla anguilla TaxID=7936 RepID=A0A0E9SK03_ANGAN
MESTSNTLKCEPQRDLQE